jgi:hypothetical protein
MRYDINVIYFLVDEFCKIYEGWQRHRLISCNQVRLRGHLMSLSEMLTVMIIYHLSPCREFKSFYKYFLITRHHSDFSRILSYNRFVALMPTLLVPLICMIHCLSGNEDNIYFIDSTKMQVCHNKRTSSNRVFKGLATIGRSSYGWFMGFKLHLIINTKGQIIAVKITKGNIDDRNVAREITKNLSGKIFGDKGYISKDLFNQLFKKGLKIITGIKNNMKNYLLSLQDKILLRKRSLIESVFNIMKNHMNLEHTRHRSPINFLVNTLSCLVAYQLKTNKPHLKNYNRYAQSFSEKLLEFNRA